VPLTAVPGPALDKDPVAGHEGGVKADTELADEIDVFFRRFGEPARKVFEPEWAMVPRLASSSCRVMPMPVSVMVRVCFCHHRLNGDLKRNMGVEDIRGGEALMSEFFQGIGRIGDQLADKRHPAPCRENESRYREVFWFQPEIHGWLFYLLMVHLL
jgi:hypothetical protein